MNKPNFSLFGLVLLAGFSSVALAANISFMSNSALSFLTKEDWQLSKAAEREALNHYKDGQSVAWANPKTGSHGMFLPLRSTTNQKGEQCRHLKMVNSAHLVNEKATFRFCKLQDQWKIV